MNVQLTQSTKYELSDPNSCGQGKFLTISDHPFTSIMLKYGYRYSHSTNVTFGDSRWMLYHTFEHTKNPEHKVSFYQGSSLTLNTTCSTSSNRNHTCMGINDIERHLTYKSQKYNLSKS